MKVSVITPVFNPTQRFYDCLKSIAWQSYADIEHIIVDDGSDNSVPEFFKNIQHSDRLKYIRLDKNLGRGAARHRALEEVRGDFIAMVDADDWVYPRKIEKQVEFLNQNKTVDLISTAMIMASAGNAVGIENYGHTRTAHFHSLKTPQYMNIPHAPSMIRTEVAKRIQYSPDFRSSEDFDFLMRLLFQSEYAFLPEPLYVYDFLQTKSSARSRCQLMHSRKIFWSYMRSYPISSALRIFETYGKQFFYQLINANPNFKKVFLQRRYQKIDSEILAEYDQLAKTLSSV